MNCWLLIPVKSFEAGKGRLRGTLSEEDRRSLNAYFLRRLLTTASQFPGLARTAVISPCDGVLGMATDRGAHAIRQIGSGLNGAAREGVEKLSSLGAELIILMACDIPTVRSCDLHKLARLGHERKTIVICPDKHGSGTNALVLTGGTRMEFQFGEASLSKHCHEAARIGFAPHVHQSKEIAMDIDTPLDLRAWGGVSEVMNEISPFEMP